ncbi:MAG: hypothetical protein A3J62_00795 [Candidatus Buchananbacteria bacterium RIFCSPHIGHO2_02_FULL_38_8]|uniref:MobA-like NTP transferase domain-containing protein n=1 Tax=Candidatus Buchananbacteria bacterium RIFCSPHIGHO2_02_FULL_38_8 TaxID=1797538 RepID=A0A1G1Y6E2_9BACT|nr:MAG: hypothetical protein A3J62_00795 [Candidatus Buchananbacteria bacterium RIFCSPHIGHO2_02_FULL_38_8]
MSNQVQVIILAAGQGKRMENKKLPKVLIPLNGKPIISHLLEAVKESGVCDKPLIVVGQRAAEVKSALGSNYLYVFQEKQLGTGHAVASTQKVLNKKAENIMVLYGDHPFINAQTIRNLAQTHFRSNKVLTMATVKVDNFDDWRNSFWGFGRIIRDSSGKVCGIIEHKDATKKQFAIKEVNPAYFCFKADWLWENLWQLKKDNIQDEYYLTDLVGMACQQGHEIATIEIEPKEALGINTVEQLELVSKLAK